MNHSHQLNTISFSHTESDLLPLVGDKLTEFSIDKRRRWCCSNCLTKPFFGTLHGECRHPSVPWSRLHFILHQILFFFFRLKAMILSLKCLLFLVVVLTTLQNGVSAAEEQKDEKLTPDRFYDQDFLPNNWIYNRNVTCGKQTKGIFPSRTWTCANIRVNGRKIAYGYYPFKSEYPYPAGKCFETRGRDDMGGICLGLMEHVNETAKLWVASVTNATCGHTNDKRVLLTIDTSKPESPQYVWVDLGHGFGWVETLHCLTLPDVF